MALERIHLLNIPVDIMPPEQIEDTILGLLNAEGPKQIVFLSIWDLLKARRKGTFGECVQTADLIIPISRSILKGAAFLKAPVPCRYEPFETVISILTILEKHYKSLYLLGGRHKTSTRAAQNVKATYPKLHLVGRYPGYYPKQMEKDIVEAIFKASPSLVLMSDGVSGNDCWFHIRKNCFSGGIFMYYKDALPIFAKCRKHVSKKTFAKGLEIYGEILRNPLKIFYIFRYFYYWCLLFKSRIAHK